MNTPFNPAGAQSSLDDYVPENLKGKTYRTESHDLNDVMEREDVIEARKMLNRMVEDEATAEAAVLIACEILSLHAVNKESDFTAVSQVSPNHVGGRTDVAFEISTKMTIGGKA